MSFPGSPALLKAGIVLLDAESGAVRKVIAFQYNPDSLVRTLVPQGVGPDSGDRLETLRLKGPPVETIKLDAEVDAVDELDRPGSAPGSLEFGVAPLIAALEMIVYPSTGQLLANQSLAAAGTIEIIPSIAPLAVFVWSRNRVVPVRLTEFTVTEEAFDGNLNPIRAKVSLGLRVLSIDDLRSDSFGASLYLGYQRTKESLAGRTTGGLSRLGLKGIG